MVARVRIIDLDREAIEESRRLSFEQKFLAGAELFDYACAISRAGIRQQNPGFSDEQVRAELRRRIAIGERTRSGA